MIGAVEYFEGLLLRFKDLAANSQSDFESLHYLASIAFIEEALAALRERKGEQFPLDVGQTIYVAVLRNEDGYRTDTDASMYKSTVEAMHVTRRNYADAAQLIKNNKAYLDERDAIKYVVRQCSAK